MKKRLALALALIHKPRVLILDEPTNGLDPAGARQMRAAIAEYAAGGRTIFLSTHLLDAAERFCHRVAIIQKGKLQAIGTPDELRAGFGARRERPWRISSCGSRPMTARRGTRRAARDRRAADRRRHVRRAPPRRRRAGRLMIRSRLRSFRNGLRVRGSAEPLLVAIAGSSSRSPTSGLFSQAFATIVASVGLAEQAAALGLVTGALTLGSLTAKAASSDAVRAGSAENEFLMARPSRWQRWWPRVASPTR